MAYITYMFNCELSHSTVSCYISGISFYSKLSDLDDNTKKFVIRKMLDGFKRAMVNKKDARLPVSRRLLGKILGVLPVICKSNYESQMFRAAFSLCFHGMFRVSELTFKGPNFNSHAIKIENLKLTSNSIEMLLLSSKTDQFGRGVSIHISAQKDLNICPVDASH